MNIWRGAACAVVVVVPAQIAWAGEQPLYAPAPGWITVAKLPDTATGGTAAGPVLYDVQQRVDGATVWNYVDTALKLDTPEALSQSSNLTLAWAPDKGDLIIHQVAIIRNGEEIDALAGGQKFTVLRREQTLEQRELTGVLSATLAVEGLRVGDVLRLRMSTTVKDAALGGRAQLALPLVAEPAPIKAASYKLSWRTGDATQWKVLSGNVDAQPKRVGEFSELPIVMPIAKLAEIPEDAPGRFQRLPLIEASTFASWADVSKIMAPLYATDGTISAGSALAGEVATIKAATNDPLKRTAMALQLVQDKVRYLAVGMDGGNYVPQTPAKTWDVRYGYRGRSRARPRGHGRTGRGPRPERAGVQPCYRRCKGRRRDAVARRHRPRRAARGYSRHPGVRPCAASPHRRRRTDQDRSAPAGATDRRSGAGSR